MKRSTCSWSATRRRLCSQTASSSRRITTPIYRLRNGGDRSMGASMQREPNAIQCCCTAGEKNWARCHLGLAVTLWMLMVCLLLEPALALKRSSPVRIGVLTASWGPPPAAVGLIEGLVAMGYRENEDFVIGVRFTRGDSAVLPAVAR